MLLLRGIWIYKRNRMKAFKEYPSDALYLILELIFIEKEASCFVLLLRPFTAEEAAKFWKMMVREAKELFGLIS